MSIFQELALGTESATDAITYDPVFRLWFAHKPFNLQKVSRWLRASDLKFRLHGYSPPIHAADAAQVAAFDRLQELLREI